MTLTRIQSLLIVITVFYDNDALRLAYGGVAAGFVSPNVTADKPNWTTTGEQRGSASSNDYYL
jgi:hypothetical protein|tara:strand:- start:1587 stop:1775 length:189 start_codon:yes stop_codon:yes gene_type:complete